MNNRTFSRSFRWLWPVLALVAWPVVGMAQVAVPEIEEIEELPTISASEIEALVGPIALYPDDLLAIVLPASTFPLQIVEAARFLEAFEIDSSLEPDEDWDDSIVALLNYPDVVELLNEDLDWTWRMGEAVVAQQSDVIASIESFRDRAYAAGNLESDDYQLVSQEEGTIQITPVQDDVIYVPYYEPEQVVVYQPRPVYFYHPRPYPVYYYPYPSYYAFDNHFHHSFFWGVTTAFSIGWNSYHLNTYHHSFYGHPYYGHSYRDNWWYRRPDIHIYNNTYVRNDINANYDRYGQGDRWQPSVRRTLRASDQRVTRTRYYPNSNSSPTGNSNAFTGASTNSAGQVARSSGSVRQDKNEMRRDDREREPVQFRDRQQASGTARSNTNTARTPVARNQRMPQPSSVFRAEREPAPRAAPERKQQPRMAAKSQSQPRATTKPQSQPRQSQAQPRQSQSNSSSSNSNRSGQSSRSSESRNSNSRSSKSRSSNSRNSNSRNSNSRSSERER
ncbi:MAG: DUF3300 domain-containing protein [Woeseiaceae bacterium]|nr:DUF3300 domain-containing protein [Woeseiaceae bacterium]